MTGWSQNDAQLLMAGVPGARTGRHTFSRMSCDLLMDVLL